jgi:hypothetical protein
LPYQEDEASGQIHTDAEEPLSLGQSADQYRVGEPLFLGQSADLLGSVWVPPVGTTRQWSRLFLLQRKEEEKLENWRTLAYASLNYYYCCCCWLDSLCFWIYFFSDLMNLFELIYFNLLFYWLLFILIYFICFYLFFQYFVFYFSILFARKYSLSWEWPSLIACRARRWIRSVGIGELSSIYLNRCREMRTRAAISEARYLILLLFALKMSLFCCVVSHFSIYLYLSLTGRIAYNEKLLRVTLMRDWCFSCRLKWENVAMVVGYFQCLLIGQRYFVEIV